MLNTSIAEGGIQDGGTRGTLSRQIEFEGASLLSAVKGTFANRETKLPKEPTALTEQFSNTPGKQAQWAGFLRKSRLTNAPTALEQVIADLRPFLLPIADAAGEGGILTASGIRWVRGSERAYVVLLPSVTDCLARCSIS